MPLFNAKSKSRRGDLRVEIWLDLICPWCWIGKHRFQKALDRFEHKDYVSVVHHAFRLMPGAAPQPIESIMIARFGSLDNVKAQFAKVREVAASEALDCSLSGTLVGDTSLAHRVSYAAAKQGLRSTLIDDFYHAYFTDHLSLFDRETLARLAMAAGVDTDALYSSLNGQTFIDDVQADQDGASLHQVKSVPFFVIDGRWKFGGCSTEEFLSALHTAWNSRQ